MIASLTNSSWKQYALQSVHYKVSKYIKMYTRYIWIYISKGSVKCFFFYLTGGLCSTQTNIQNIDRWCKCTYVFKYTTADCSVKCFCRWQSSCPEVPALHSTYSSHDWSHFFPQICSIQPEYGPIIFMIDPISFLIYVQHNPTCITCHNWSRFFSQVCLTLAQHLPTCKM